MQEDRAHRRFPFPLQRPRLLGPFHRIAHDGVVPLFAASVVATVPDIMAFGSPSLGFQLRVGRVSSCVSVGGIR